MTRSIAGTVSKAISHLIGARVGARLVLLACATLLAACGTRLKPHIIQQDSRAVEVVTAGTGPVTVVFESGLGDDWAPWDDVASEVAASARVFAYSRPGYGHSDAATTPRDPAHIVEELRALLDAQGARPPYVLVGHSFGGTYMELFAKAHPDEVAGAVLVDPRHRDFTTATDAAGIRGCSIPASAVPSLPDVQRAEVEGFAGASAEIHAAGPFGRYPVRVLTATSHPIASECEAPWISMLKSLAGEAANGEQIVYEGASHYLQHDRPHEVARTILAIVAAERPQ